MDKQKFYDEIKGQLIVSCQALEGEPLYDEHHSLMPYMARAAKQGGACAIRTNGVRDVALIKEETNLPVIGLLKKKYDGFEQHITVTMDEIDLLVKANADVIALDCTLRPRVDGRTVKEYIQAIKEKYPKLLLMADISTIEEGIAAYESGVDLVGTTLSGYTPYTPQLDHPDYDLVEALAKKVPIPVIAEGRIHQPEQAAKMLQLGAHAVVVGGAITRPLEITTRFMKAMHVEG
ncbi:MAG: N-acetylmannosamine-6-phosphate 2-epimerase [Turicibacter sp.]